MMTEPKKTALTRVKRPVPKDRAVKIRSLPKVLAKYHRRLEPLVEGLVQDTLLINYQIGEIIIEAETDLDARANKTPSLRQFADHHVQHLAEAAGVDRRTFADCKRVARKYTRAEYQELVSKPWVTWPHVVHLLNAEGEVLRCEMEEMVVSERLSAKDLQAEIRARQGNRRKGTGRKPKVPNTLNVAFFQLQAQTAKLTRSVSEVWFGPQFDMATELRKCPADEIDSKTVLQIDDSITSLEDAENAIRTAIRKLQNARRRFTAPPADA
jgi:hypothetical protein